jgi:hypothetical protein
MCSAPFTFLTAKAILPVLAVSSSLWPSVLREPRVVRRFKKPLTVLSLREWSHESTRKPALFATRSLAVYSRRNMMLKPSLSFAGPREYRWQGLEVPVMMDKRRGTAQIATASPTACAARSS